MKTYCLKSIYYSHCEEGEGIASSVIARSDLCDEAITILTGSQQAAQSKNRDWPRRGWTRHFLGHFALGRFAPAGLAMTNGGHKGQSIAEYFILISVISIAIVALGFVGRAQNTFGEYFNDAAQVMTQIDE